MFKSPAISTIPLSDPIEENLDHGATLEHLVEVKCTVKIINKKDRYELLVIAPGFKKRDFTIKIVDGILTIAAVLGEDDEEESGGNWQGFSNSSFFASFKLPKAASVAHVHGAYSGGIFMITLLKSSENAQPAKVKKHLVVKKYQYGQYFHR